MPKMIGRNQNKNDEASVNEGVALDATTSVVIAAANPDRIAFHVNNNSAVSGAWVKLQAASIDNDKKGIFLEKSVLGINQWDMPTDNIYTGEISAIAENGTPSVFVTEY